MPETTAPALDRLGRTPIADGMKQQIADAFKIVGPKRTGAVIVFHDLETGTTEGQFAAKIDVGDGRMEWKVAGGGRFKWEGEKPSGWVGIGAEWGGGKE